MLYRMFQKWIFSFEGCITLGNMGVPEGLSSFTKNHLTMEIYECDIWPIWCEVRYYRIRTSHEWCPYLHQSLTGLCPHAEIWCEMFDDIYIVWHPPFHAYHLQTVCSDVETSEFCQTCQVWYHTHLQIMLIYIYFWESALVTPTKQWGSVEWGTQCYLVTQQITCGFWISHSIYWVFARWNYN
jgi:hypothetical protein